ncbi:DUF952 domain-containing protein [Hymenobacter cellulosilyticus]|uniref:DUF952 domain-containing protein n=1 Tax=Hymenobacter cellulosilyticus TaxID=2932248 RepID=A0A8T9Q7C1_9BACT|nr:DUF952 domain-containing protein [Hymenobacter cellulosilyticus]UOQ71680.1 DUF952 domain-containing protein [Hymenobacter cellulosilyticus]
MSNSPSTLPPAFIYRLAEAADWEQAQQTGFFASADLAAEGFIHASDQEQVLATAARYYAGRQDIVLLQIDENQLRAAGVRVEREWVAARGEAFAHVFGRIPRAVITRAWELMPTVSGNFELPAALS